MKVRLTLIDREGENDPVEVRLADKVNGVRDDKSNAKAVIDVLQRTMAILHSPLGAPLAANIAAFEALLAKQAAETTNDDDDEDFDDED